MQIHLNLIGVILIVLAVVHVIFPRYFKWKEEFKSISLINRQMMYVHTLFIAAIVLLMGILCVTSGQALITTPLGKKICLGFGIFWLLRLFIQFFGYSSTLWRGKRFETSVHILFAILWTYMSAVFLWVWGG